jgi:thiamine biosynthesis lipoprotein
MTPAGPFRFEHTAMNTRFEILAYGPSEDLVEHVAEVAFRDINHLEESFSYYLDTSELAEVNREASDREVEVGRDLAAVLEASRILHASTGGAFDPSVGPLMKCWRFHDGKGRLPEAGALAAARRRVGFRHVRVDAARRTVRFEAPGLELDLGGIGKGYAVDAAVARIRSFRFVTAAMIHGGTSSAYALGAPPGQPGWPFRLRSPRDMRRGLGRIVLRDRSISGSAPAENSFRKGGRRYGHILDPRTGEPARGADAAWAVAPTATESDVLSKAFFVFSPAETRAYCRANPEVGAVVLPEGALRVRRYGAAR